jgi:hypothetical protein
MHFSARYSFVYYHRNAADLELASLGLYGCGCKVLTLNNREDECDFVEEAMISFVSLKDNLPR